MKQSQVNARRGLRIKTSSGLFRERLTPRRRTVVAHQPFCSLCAKSTPCSHFSGVNNLEESRKSRRESLEIGRANARFKARQRHRARRAITPLKRFREELLIRQTPAELKFYSLCGAAWPRRKVKRQSIHGNYIVDFYFPSCRLGVEIDGGYHRVPAQSKKDQERSDNLRSVHGIRVIRFSNEQVINEPAFVRKVLNGILTGEATN